MIGQYDKLVFIDLETTGPNPECDRITEIGIVEVSAAGVQQWSTLINPEVPIPPFIRQLTGIDDDMVRDAPLFSAVGEELFRRLEGGLFIAHNARFDYGFLRSAFRRIGANLRCEVLCTVKLSRKLFPHEPRHSLDALVERHGLVCDARHRALADADLVWQYWRMLETTVAADTLEAMVGQLLQRPNLPVHLDPDLLDDLPDGPGVYVFFGEGNVALHVGKASQLRSRVLSYFHADRPTQKAQRLAQELHRIDWHETLGDIGAQLLEARLARQLQPAYGTPVQSPRGLCSWQLQTGEDGVPRLALRRATEPEFGRTARLFGLFSTRQKAEGALHALAEKHGLLLTGADLRPQCRGDVTPGECTERLESALASLKLLTWPYPGPIALIEQGHGGRQDLHIVDNWCCLGTVQTERDARRLLDERTETPRFEPDTYRIVSRAMATGKAQVRVLDRHAEILVDAS